VVVVEQILIRNLPAGTKAALRALPSSISNQSRPRRVRSLPTPLIASRGRLSILGTDEGADIEFEPERLGLTARTPNL